MDRHWVFVRNNYTDEDEHAVFALELIADAVVCGKEVGEERHTPHLQGAVSFKEAKSGKQMQQMLPGFDHEPKAKKSLFAVFYGYCEKGEQTKSEWEKLNLKGPNYGKNADVFSVGKRSVDRGDAQKQFWTEQLIAVRERRIKDLDPKVRAVHLKNLVYSVEIEKVWDLPPAVALPGEAWEFHQWHYGVSNGGKSHFAENHPDCYQCSDWKGDFMCNYAGQKYIHIKDFDPHFPKRMISFFKNFFDRFPVEIRRKQHPNQMIRPIVIITSNYLPEQIWADEDLAPMERRFSYYIYRVPYLGNPDWRPPTPERVPPAPFLNLKKRHTPPPSPDRFGQYRL